MTYPPGRPVASPGARGRRGGCTGRAADDNGEGREGQGVNELRQRWDHMDTSDTRATLLR